MAKILILGNRAVERQGLLLVMEFAGHKCTEAATLDDALQQLKKESSEIVLSDASIGDRGTEELIHSLKKAAPGVCVMLLTEEEESEQASDEVITVATSPIRSLATNFSPIPRKDAVLVLLPDQDSLKVLKNLPRTPGMLNKLAVLYHSQEKFAPAELLYTQALEVSEKLSGDHRREVASVLSNLGRLYLDQKQYAKAEPLFRKTLTLAESAYGKAHPKVLRRAQGLADLYREQGRGAEAAEVIKRYVGA